MKSIFSIPAYFVMGITGLWSLVISLKIIAEEFGEFWAFVAFWIAPILLTVTPFYEGFKNSNWYLAILTYGGTALYFGLFSLAVIMEDKFE